MSAPRRRRTRPVLVVLGALLAGFGVLAILSIGFPFLVAGVLMVVAGSTGVHRRHARVFWPVAAGLAAFFLGYLLLAPLSCTARGSAPVDATDTGTASSEAGSATTECANLLGIDYSGGAGYDPSLWPALGGGLASAVTIAMVTSWAIPARDDEA